MDCKRIRALALDLAFQAGKLQKQKFRKPLKIRFKRVTDPVTEVDRACEALIVKGIRRVFPTHAVLGEEDGAQGPTNADFTWIIDPLDGTVNYSHGLPMHSVSIGVFEKQARPFKAQPGKLSDPGFGLPLFGVVHAAQLGETFTAERGKGAYLNGKRIHVSRQAKPLEAVLASGFSYGARQNGENMREWMECLNQFEAIRRMGAATLDLCWVACGRFDAFWEYGLKAWDAAAAGLIAQEAGALITNIQGKAFALGQPGIVVSNRPLQRPLLNALKRATARKLAWPPR